MNRLVAFLGLTVYILGCHRVPDKIEPKLNYLVQERYLKTLPSPFSHNFNKESLQDWEKEEKIGRAFAKELDLYQTVTAMKRASFLIPSGSDFVEKRQQLAYTIFAAYYFGGKYCEALDAFENSSLREVRAETFVPYRDLLLMMYDSYLNVGQDEKALRMISYIQNHYPAIGQRLELSRELYQGDVKALQGYRITHPELDRFLLTYDRKKKSVGTAQFLNTILPGTGFLYLGQMQSAFTALAINATFIWASVYFFSITILQLESSLRALRLAGISEESMEQAWRQSFIMRGFMSG